MQILIANIFQCVLLDMEKREYFDKWRAYYFHKIRKLLISNDALKISRQLYKPVINKKYDVEQAYNLLVFSSKGIYLTEDDSNFPILLYLDDVYLVDKYSALKHLKMMNFILKMFLILPSTKISH